MESLAITSMAAANICDLPENCISYVLSLTSPKDACRSAAVSSVFRAAFDSDLVWKRFLPSDCSSLLSRAVSPVLDFRTNKDLFFFLASSPILIDSAAKSFWLDKSTGKKCYMISARQLRIVWGEDERYWRWMSSPESRFGEVAVLLQVCWLEIRSSISLSDLTPNTKYAAYMVLKHNDDSFGFGIQDFPATLSVTIQDENYVSEHEGYLHMNVTDHENSNPVVLDLIQMPGLRVPRFWRQRRMRVPEQLPPSCLQRREGDDGWMEVELGEFFRSDGSGDGVVEFKLEETKGGRWKGGLVLCGIEIRPKS